MTMIGEKSIPIPDMGINCRTRYKTGSVILCKNKIIEINGIDESIFRDKLTAKIPNLFKELQP